MSEPPSHSIRKRDNRAALPLIAPFVLVYAALFVWPSLQMLAMSFTDAQLIVPGEWVGLSNYAKLFTDFRFRTAILNTAYFVLMTVIPSTALGLLLAVLVSRLKGIWQGVALACFFIPYILPVTTVTSIAYAVTEPRGPLGFLSPHAIDGRPFPLWGEVSMFLPGVAALTVWWTVGFNVLLFLAGLRNIPPELYEAARLDGAGRLAMFWRITWPLIWPVTVLILTLQVIMQIKVFDQVYLMVQGRVDSTLVLVQYIYTLAFQRNQGGYAATVAVALFVIVVALATLQVQRLRARAATA